MAKNQFWYLDNDATTVTSDAAANLGMRHRAVLSHEGITVEIILPLNRYSFFEGLSERLLPPMQLEFEIVLQDDTEMIFQSDGTARRIVVRKFELWVPRLQFTGEGQKLVNENFLNCISKDLIQDDFFFHFWPFISPQKNVVSCILFPVRKHNLWSSHVKIETIVLKK